MDLVEIPLGTDRMQAQFIADACRSEGLDVDVVMFDETRYEMGPVAAIDNKLLVRPGEADAARQIVRDLHPALSEPDQDGSAGSLQAPALTGRRVVALVLLVALAGGVLFTALTLVINLLT